jgi:cytochrome c peroxidase
MRLGRRFGFVVVALSAAVTFAVCASQTKTAKRAFDPHAVSPIESAKLNRILRATASASAAVSRTELAAEGQQLFRSTAVAQRGLSCESCHPAGAANHDLGVQNHPTKAGDFTGARDPIALWGVTKTAPYLWPGNVATLNEMTVRVIKNFFKDGATQADGVTAQQTAALIAYMETLEPPARSFALGTMSPAAVRGELLFRGKAGCSGCHSGPFFTDGLIHDILVPRESGNTDPGSAVVPNGFNTPMLRDVAATAPYMHSGLFNSLSEVVDFYASRSIIAPLPLTQTERDDLVAYLEAL